VRLCKECSAEVNGGAAYCSKPCKNRARERRRQEYVALIMEHVNRGDAVPDVFDKTCKVCGAGFKTQFIAGTYCSVPCRRQGEYAWYVRRPKKTFVCETCGIQFQAFRARFCSLRCNHLKKVKSRVGGVRVCEACQTPLEAPGKRRKCRACIDRVRLLRRLKQYDLSEEQYTGMSKAQDGLCAICGTAEELVIDHCHQTGIVRGLLCSSCNLAIGNLRNCVNRCASAAEYLARFYAVSQETA